MKVNYLLKGISICCVFFEFAKLLSIKMLEMPVLEALIMRKVTLTIFSQLKFIQEDNVAIKMTSDSYENVSMVDSYSYAVLFTRTDFFVKRMTLKK